jgi:hypothetical protein
MDIKQPLRVFFQYAAIHTIFDALLIVVSARNMLILLSLIYLNIIKVRIPRARVQPRINLLPLHEGEIAVFLQLIQRAAERTAGGGVEGQTRQQYFHEIAGHQGQGQQHQIFAAVCRFIVRQTSSTGARLS